MSRFADAAGRLTALAEGRGGDQAGGAGAGDLTDLQAALQAALCEVHAAFLALPEGEEAGHAPPDEANFAQSQRAYERWRRASPRLADALAGVYRDLIDGLELYGRGTTGDREAALWAWQSLYWQHWGDELLKAQQALYRLMARRRFDRALDDEGGLPR
ncbi:MAG: DUF5063 domain-containing protein [Bacillota bacterium]